MTQPLEPSQPHDSPPAWVERAHWVILAALLALMVARTTLSEPPFARAPLREAGAFAGIPLAEQIYSAPEVTRVASAVIIVAMASLWALTGAVGGGLRLRGVWFGVILALLTGCLFASAAGACDRRAAFNTAAEQSSLLLAAWLAMQLCRSALRRRCVLIVLIALAALLGAKGAWQVLVEIPDQVADFQAHRGERLAQAGLEDDSTDSRLFEVRLRERTTKGWFALANVYGSLMILLTLAAAGVAADTWLAARRGPPGDMSAPVAAIGVTLIALAGAVSLCLTASKGAIACGAVAAAGAVAISLVRSWAARHRRALVIATAAVFVAAAAGVVAYGAARGSLPSRSLQVRWEYWTGAADIVRDRPVLGAGPGNFADAYLVHRPPGAEESVKNPHNVIVQAISEYGLLGGGLYLTLLAMLLVLVGIRGAQRPAETLQTRSPHPHAALWFTAIVAVAALAWRIAVTHYPNGWVLAYDNWVPVAGLAAGVAVGVWACRLASDAGGSRFTWIALACGLAGFALHNLSDFALFLPGAAMVFYVAAGALVAGRTGRAQLVHRTTAAALAVLLGAVTVWLTIDVLRPVRQSSAAVRDAAAGFTSRNWPLTRDALLRATRADPYDAAPSADLAGLLIQQARQARGDERRQHLTEAAVFAAEAMLRNAARAAYHITWLEGSVFFIDPTLLDYQDDAAVDPNSWRAFYKAQTEKFARADDWITPEAAELDRMDGQNIQLRLRLARLAWQSGQLDLLNRQLDAAERIDAALWPPSAYRLTDAERALIDRLRSQARAAAAKP